MILKTVLFLSYAILVSANNEFPVMPAQSYPIYQQNGYANPSANQPSDISSYLQSMIVQNQSPSLNLSPSNIRQMLLNRILSNIPMQTIFDQNSKGYGSNLVGFPNNPGASSPVNNYFAVPTVYEYLNNQTGTNNDDEAVDFKTEEKRKKNKKRKSSKSKRKNGSQKNHNNSSKNDKVNDIQDNNDRDSSKKSRKRSRKSNTEASSHDNHLTNSENEINKKKKKRKHKESEVNNLVDEETKVENPKPRRRHKKKPKPDKDNKENIISEQQTTPKPEQIQQDLNLANFNEGILEENRVPRNPILDVNDLLKSIPSLPENIANSFNFKGLPQFNNNPAMSNLFANYENMYQSMLSNNKGTVDQREIKRKKPKRSRKNNKRKIEVKNRNFTATEATASSTSKPAASPKINVVTTEKTIYITEKTRTNIDPIPKDEDLKSIDKQSEIKEATITEFKNQEFEEIQDIESNINEPVSDYEHVGDGYIDDYYPLFTDNAAYNANKREVYIKNLGDTKYYYAVDKENPDLINRMRFEGFGIPQRIIKDYELNKKYDNAGKEGKTNPFKPDFKDIKEEPIEFRSPPHLESPDFQTRKVERSEINPEPYYNFNENEDFDDKFVGDKASIYSGAKISYYSGTEQNSRKILKDKHKDVESVFTSSKVASHGTVYYPEGDSTSPETSTQASTYDSDFKDGNIAYVYAKSLDYPESFP